MQYSNIQRIKMEGFFSCIERKFFFVENTNAVNEIHLSLWRNENMQIKIFGMSYQICMQLCISGIDY